MCITCDNKNIIIRIMEKVQLFNETDSLDVNIVSIDSKIYEEYIVKRGFRKLYTVYTIECKNNKKVKEALETMNKISIDDIVYEDVNLEMIDKNLIVTINK